MDKTFKEQARAAMQDFLSTATTELSRKSVPYVDLAKKLVAIKKNEFFKVAADDASRSYRTFNAFLNKLDVATENKKILTVCMDIVQELESHPDDVKAILDRLPDNIANWKAILSARKEDVINILKEAAGIAEDGRKIAASDIKQAMASLNAVAAKGGFDPFKVMWSMLKKIPAEEILARVKNDGFVVETQEEAMHVLSVLEPIVKSLKEKYHAFEGVEEIKEDLPGVQKDPEIKNEPEPPTADEEQTLAEKIDESLTPPTSDDPETPKGPSVWDKAKDLAKRILANNTMAILLGVASILVLFVAVLLILYFCVF